MVASAGGKAPKFKTLTPDRGRVLDLWRSTAGCASSSINASILSYGFPKVIEEGGALRIGIEGLEVQTLYAFVDRGSTKDLAGVLVYTRVHNDTLVLLHMAVRPEFCYSSGYKNELVLVRILAQLRAIAKRIRGIKKLSILYADKEIPRALI